MMQRISSLDGVRGLAISMVVLLHMFSHPSAGWLGVDIFFVLSGYLITSILLRERHEPYFWQMFYTRRLTRIAPPYIAILIAAALLTPLPWHRIWPYYAFFGANFAYLDVGKPGIGVLIVVWSLAVEEHFYFIWPGNVRFFRDRTLVYILLGVIVAEPLVRMLCMSFVHDYFLFYTLTPFRLDGLAWGALLAIVLYHPRLRQHAAKWIPPMLVASSAAFVVVFAILRLNRKDNMLFFNLFGYTLLGWVSAMLLGWLILRPSGLLAKVFSFAPLVFLGRISYGLYLYHILIKVECTEIAHRFGYMHDNATALVALPLSILIAWLSFRYVESRFLSYGRQRVREYQSRASLQVAS